MRASHYLYLGILIILALDARPCASSPMRSQKNLIREEKNAEDVGVRSEEQGDCTYCCTTSCVRHWKLGFAAIIFAEGLIFAYTTYLIKHVAGAYHATVLHICNALSGGIFFATGLLHILPEAVELSSGDEHHSEEEGEGEEEVKFPLGYCMVLVGFYAFVLLEKVLLPKIALGHTHMHPEHDGADIPGADIPGAGIAMNNTTMNNTKAYSKPDVAVDVNGDPDTSHDHHAHESSTDATTPHHHGKKKLISKTMAGSLFIVLGLSIHSLVESIVLGLADSFTTAFNVFLATVLHRWATAAALGTKLKKKNLSFPQLSLLVLLFSIVAPIGILLGFPISNLSSKTNHDSRFSLAIVFDFTEGQGIAIGISAGIFIYVGAFEVMSDEFVENQKKPFFTLLATISGALIIIVITIITTTVLGIHG